MSLDDEKSTNGRVFIDFIDTKRTLHTLREKRVQWGKQIEIIAKKLQSEQEITNTDIENCEHMLSSSTGAAIRQTVADIKSAEVELLRLRGTLQRLGYGEDLVNF